MNTQNTLGKDFYQNDSLNKMRCMCGLPPTPWPGVRAPVITCSVFPSPGLVLGLACDECCGFHMHCDRDLGPESPSVVVPFLSSPEIKYLFPPVDCLFIYLFIYFNLFVFIFNSCLFYYSCPNFPLVFLHPAPPFPQSIPTLLFMGHSYMLFD